jgi:hypothetical protein
MKLDPSEYTSPGHHTDLTSQVQGALADGRRRRAAVAYRRKSLPGQGCGPRPFEQQLLTFLAK